MVIRKNSVFVKILIPLLILGIFQSVLMAGAVLLGGTLNLLRDNAQRILTQNLQNRQITLENLMIQNWSNVDDCVKNVQMKAQALLDARGKSYFDLRTDTELSNEYLLRVSDNLLQAMRKNTATGVFLILSNGQEATYPGLEQFFNGVYYRNMDPHTDPTDNSDILMERGPAAIAAKQNIPMDSLWEAQFRYVPVELGGNGMSYYFKPYFAARTIPNASYKDLGWWSEPFLLSADSRLDSEQVITYSVPLVSPSGTVFGVLGTEVSLDVFQERLPDREVDSQNRGGYMLLTYESQAEGKVLKSRAQILSSNIMKQLVHNHQEFSLERAPDSGLYQVISPETSRGDPVYASLVNLNLYKPNTPFSQQQWALAALVDGDALFGIADSLRRNVFITSLISLLISAFFIAVVASKTTRPLYKATERLRRGGSAQLADESSGIAEIDELFQVIQDLNRKQKRIEADLKNERERYLLALESTTDMILEYDREKDTLLIYHIEKENGKSRVIVHDYPGYLQQVNAGQIIHPDDRALALEYFSGQRDEATLRCQAAPGSPGYRWFYTKGRVVLGDDGAYIRTIGSARDVTEEKEAALRAEEANRRDKLTGLLKRGEGEYLLAGVYDQPVVPGYLMLLDVDGFAHLNEEYGMLYCDLLLESLGKAIQYCDTPGAVSMRYGGDEFLIYYPGLDKEEVLRIGRGLCESAASLDGGNPESELSVTCSVGVTRAGGVYSEAIRRAIQILEYAKRHGGGMCLCYEDLPRDAVVSMPHSRKVDHVANSYYEYDDNLVSLALNLFEKATDVKAAVPMLLSKLGRSFALERISILEADADFYTMRVAFQWCAFTQSKLDRKPVHYTGETFRALLDQFEKNADLRDGNLPDACRQMFQSQQDAGILCCPMYDKGHFMGCAVFVSGNERAWDGEDLETIKEIVKLLSAHISKSRADLASRAKSEFLSRMSHEIRTPMNAIMGMTNIAMCLPELPLKVGDCLQKIDMSAHYLLSLLNDILDMSKIESGKMVLAQQPFQLGKMVQDLDTLMRPQAENKGLKLEFVYAVEHNCLLGDSLRLNQILVNLLSNAVKFTDAGGTITVTVRQMAFESERVRVYFSVKDTGIGIAETQVERIFRAFEQEESDTAARYGGTGLGLSISSNLVRMMGGKLEVETAPEKGSDFYFTIPLSIDAAAVETEDTGTQEPQPVHQDLTGKKVLLVEDNELNIEIAREILQMSGLVVTEARDGQEAVDIFQASQPHAFDAILMDIRMPVMDGLEATRIIRRMDRPDAVSVPIIAMTANAFDDDMRKSIESGMNGHLAKPFEIDKLLELLERLI